MPKTISFVLWKEEAKAVEKFLNILMVGDSATLNRTIIFTVESAEGRDKVHAEFDL